MSTENPGNLARFQLLLTTAILVLVATDVGLRFWDRINPRHPNLTTDFGEFLGRSNILDHGSPIYIDETKGPPYVIVANASPVGSNEPTHRVGIKFPSVLAVTRVSDDRMLWIPVHSIARIESLPDVKP